MKTAVIIALLLVVAFAAIYFVFQKPSYPMSEDEAKKFFIEDLKEKYPGASTREIMDISPVQISDGSKYFQLKALVINGASTPCPERMHVYYDYPPKNFVAQQPEYITRGCKVCMNVQKCILAFPEEAIIASHTYNGTDEIGVFIRENSDATASASAKDIYGNYTGVWQVSWSSNSSSFTYDVFLSKSENRVVDIVKGIRG